MKLFTLIDFDVNGIKYIYQSTEIGGLLEQILKKYVEESNKLVDFPSSVLTFSPEWYNVCIKWVKELGKKILNFGINEDNHLLDSIKEGNRISGLNRKLCLHLANVEVKL